MANPTFSTADIETAVKETAGSLLPTEEMLDSCVSEIEAEIHMGTSGLSIVDAFKKVITATSTCTDPAIIDPMVQKFPVELVKAQKARTKAIQEQAEQAKKEAEKNQAKTESEQKRENRISDVAQAIGQKTSDVNSILADARKKVPVIKGAAAEAGVDDVDTDLDAALADIETAAKELMACHNAMKKVKTLKAADEADDASTIHLQNAKDAENTINRVEVQVNSAVSVVQATTKKEEVAANKTEEEKIGQFDRFLSSWWGHAAVVGVLIAAISLAWLRLNQMIFAGVFLMAFVVMAAYVVLAAKKRARNGQNLVLGYSGLVVILVLFFSTAWVIKETPNGDQNIKDAFSGPTVEPTALPVQRHEVEVVVGNPIMETPPTPTPTATSEP